MINAKALPKGKSLKLNDYTISQLERLHKRSKKNHKTKHKNAFINEWWCEK